MRRIPVMLKGRQVMTIEPTAGIISRVYEKLWKICSIKKIYHVHSPVEKIIIEAKR